MKKFLCAALIVFALGFISCGAVPAFAAGMSTKEFLKLCEAGTPEEIQAAIRGGADVETADENGWTPLMLAAWFNKHFYVLHLLIDAGADVDARDKVGWTALMHAAAGNADPEIVSALLMARSDVNAADLSGRTALILAAERNPNPEIVRVLLYTGADADAKDTSKKRAINYAREDKALKNTSVYYMLQQAGVEEVPAPPMDADVFCGVCLLGSPEAIEEAIRDGADVNAVDESGVSPLGWAARERAKVKPESVPEIVSILLKAGADPDARDGLGWTALEHAMIESDSIDPEVVTILLKAGADANAVNKQGVTILMFAAAYSDDTKVLSALLDAGADVNAKREDGSTALMVAALMNPNPDIIAVLLEAGADSSAKDAKGKRAIDYAGENKALKGTKAYKMLLEASK